MIPLIKRIAPMAAIAIWILSGCESAAAKGDLLEFDYGKIRPEKTQPDTSKQRNIDDEVITFEEVKDSLQLFRKHNNRAGLARSYEQLGDLHKKNQNSADAAAHYLMAAEQYQQLNQTDKVIQVYHDVVVLYRQHNHFQEALSYAQQARKLSGKIRNDSLVAVSAFQLGRIYEELGQHQRAAEAYAVALNQFKRYDRSVVLADTYHHMAEVQEAMGNQSQSLDLHQMALNIRNDVNDSSGLADSYYQLGQFYANNNQPEMAIKYHQQAADITSKMNNPVEEAQNYIQIGTLNSRQNDYEKAADYANRALQIANQFDALELKVDALRLALSVHAQLGNSSRVNSLQGELVDLQDSLEELKQKQQQRNLAFHMQTQEKVDSLKQLQRAHAAQTAQLEREHYYLIMAILTALALTVILILLYNRYQYRKQQEKLLLNKNDALEQLNNRLEALNEEKNEILQTVTHDMKNPLSGIIGLTDLAMLDADKIEREKMLKFMHQIKQLAYNMNDMIKKLLDIRTIESGGLKLGIGKENVRETLDEVIKNNMQHALDKSLDIIKRSEIEEQDVLGDHSAIQRVLDNIISNAIKYSPEGKKIYVDMQQNNGNIRVEVTDEGPGIKPEERGKLFSKFGRLSSKTTGGEHSTGLGLYIAKQLAEQMNGEIGCNSELGEGSVFFLELPRAQSN